MWFLAGQSISLSLDFLVDDILVIPTSAEYQVFDNLGVQLLAGPLSVSSNTAAVSVDASFNNLNPANPFEYRFISWSFIHQGNSHTRYEGYQIRPFLPLTATPSDVRRELGLDVSELPDRDIDVFAAYFQLVQTYGSAFSALFTSPTLAALNVNTAVAVQAALNLCFSLEMRAGITTRSEDHLFSRKTSLDYDALRLRLRQRLDGLIQTALGTSSISTNAVVFQLTTPTDAVTG